MTTVYLCEKPSQAGDIARVLGIAGREDGYIKLKSGDAVTWAFGHLLRQLEPDDYKDEWKKWDASVLPMVPEVWRVSAYKDKTKQLKIIAGLLKSANQVVIASDAGREGEVIAREILDFCKYKGAIKRLWVSSLEESDVRRELNNLRPNSFSVPLYEAGLARSHADWLYGMNLTRGVTLTAGLRDVFPVGRVKVPTIAILVHREKEIRNFRAQDYYELEASVKTKSGHTLTLYHAPVEEHRITDRAAAEKLKAQAEHARGPLSVKKRVGLTKAPPLPFSLTTLQGAAGRAFGLPIAKTLEIAQALYETHKVITYPRTGCQYLASSQKESLPKVLSALQGGPHAKAVGQLLKLGPLYRDSVFNDAKLTDHHAIVPTKKVPTGLSEMEAKVYGLVVLRTLQALGPDQVYDETKIAMDANGVPFTTSGQVVTRPGWTAISL